MTRFFAFGLLLVIPATLLAFLPAEEPADGMDFVLRGATLYDGTDKPGVKGDVAIAGERIVAVGSFEIKGKPRILDAAGLVVTPGFIDLHTHSDSALQQPETRGNKNYLLQGVTTVITGNCGGGPLNVTEYFRKLEAGGIGSNLIHLVPHNDVRRAAMGNANRAPTAKEVEKMEQLVDAGMKAGAWGMSTGLIYNPGTYAKTDEIISLAKVVARHGGLYASHIRNEGVELLESTQEALTIGKEAGIPVHISHMKATGKNNWGKSAEQIALIEKARKAGQVVTADQYPYIASSTSLSALVIPSRYREGTQEDYLARIKDAEKNSDMRSAIVKMMNGRNGGESLRVARYSKKKEWQGRSLADIARAEKREVVDVILEIERNGGAGMVSFGMSEEDVRLIMKQPFVATASDSGSMVIADTVPHPRGYGTFPRKVGFYCRKEGVISLEHALRSCNGLPADILQLPERGYLKPGFYADLVVFDPATFIDKAIFDKPHQYADGVRWLFVNGKLAIEDGTVTKTLAGKVLRHKSTAK
jgi:N-acyl-D-aspartate/D-glutamate deacylase